MYVECEAQPSLVAQPGQGFRRRVSARPIGELRPTVSPATSGATSETFGPSIMWGFDEHRERQLFEDVQRRLIRLEASLFEEYGVQISDSAKAGLLRLIVSTPTINQPKISCDPDGLIYARWGDGAGSVLTIKPIRQDAVAYAISERSPGGPEANRQWGTHHCPETFFDKNPVARKIAGA
jgi:hypothetical protein